MDIGTGIATATAIVTGGIALVKFCGGKNGKMCPRHGEVDLALAAGEKRMNEMCNDLKVVRRIVIAIAAQQKIPLDTIMAELKEMVE